MNTADLAALRHAAPHTDPPKAIADALGVDCAGLRDLTREIAGDMDEGTKGIGWWSSAPLPTQQRILISDHLLMAAKFAETNLVEARVHLSELESNQAVVQEQMARTVSVQNGVPTVTMPRHSSAHDQLAAFKIGLHTVGCFQALGSALDCLAAVIIGVLALPDRLIRADVVGVQKTLAKAQVLAAANGLRQPTADVLEAAKDSPVDGWLDWVLSYRNTLVHRPRPVSIHQLVPKPSILDAQGRPHLRTELIDHLATEPGLSDIEAMSSSFRAVLTEAAEVSLRHAVYGTRDLIEGVSGTLLPAWVARRSAPGLLAQPASQWPNVPMHAPLGFEGFAPDSAPYLPDTMTAHPGLGRRMKVAAVLDDERDLYWP